MMRMTMRKKEWECLRVGQVVDAHENLDLVIFPVVKLLFAIIPAGYRAPGISLAEAVGRRTRKLCVRRYCLEDSHDVAMVDQ